MSSSQPLRQRLVDDSDAAIQYGEGWFKADPDMLASVGNYGPVFNSTSHATSSNTTLTFPFNGTSIVVSGTIAVKTDINNVTDPSWECFVDGAKIDNPQPTFPFGENNWNLCKAPDIAAGSHELKIRVISSGQPFYFDYVTYTPEPTDEFAEALLLYINGDSAISFSSGWQSIGGGNITVMNGAQVSLDFEGTQVTMHGYIPNEFPHAATWATYSVDAGPFVNFTLNGLPENSASVYFVPLFTTPILDSGTHKLVVTHGGDAEHTPLVLNKFVIATGSGPGSAVTESSVGSSELATSASLSPPTISLLSPSSPSASPPASTVQSSQMAKSSTSVGAVAGSTVAGGIALLSLIFLGFFCYRRRRRQHSSLTPNASFLSSMTPYPYDMSPVDDVNSPVLVTSKRQLRRATALPPFPAPASILQIRINPRPYSQPARMGTIIGETGVSGPLPTPPERNVPRIVVRHEDSGYRLGAGGAVVDLPPGYSPA
ncbi:hypothetical protein MVEN_00155600 [Mycena venus]|uniref:Uncharacterized protein n=1 Tax=Mycena venus TaxID=2733690 RepID=A0A8H6Z0W5_9AGAR|nr:hypothetical protein MVEN_00155600 [Mycena venus]